MSVIAEPKIDCHMHVLDPVRFPYNPAVAYKPAGQEIGTPAQFDAVMDFHGVTHALIVQPNSGYGSDNSLLLDTIARGKGRFKGVAIIDFDASMGALRDLQAQGIVGAAFNPTFHGSDYYRPARKLVEKLAELGMFMQLQTEHDQLLPFVKWVEEIPVPTLVDHCGRPTLADGVNQPAFQALLKLADTGRVTVKLSGYAKFSQRSYPFDDCVPFVRALASAFTLDHCIWASDWPFLRANERQDYGPLTALVARLFPDAGERAKLFSGTAKKLFGFA
ncbi:MAG: amidohydrolase family protein [Pseudolabrys sp.]